MAGSSTSRPDTSSAARAQDDPPRAAGVAPEGKPGHPQCSDVAEAGVEGHLRERLNRRRPPYAPVPSAVVGGEVSEIAHAMADPRFGPIGDVHRSCRDGSDGGE